MFEGHLHVHTEFSALDGMTKIEEAILKAKEYGQTCIAITDHGSSSGLFQASELGIKHNFDVLLGEEFYFDNETDALKTGHLILIAKNYEGLRNIFELQVLAYDNFYYKPRITMDMLKKHSSGLVCTTACIANQVGQLILMGEEELALKHIRDLHDVFEDDFYIELQSTTNPDVEHVNKVLQKIIRKYDYKCIVTTDIHYLLKEDYAAHEVLLAIQQKKKLEDKKRWKFEYNDYYLKTEEEMIKDMKGISDEVIGRCMKGISEIHEKCKNVNFIKGDYLPKFCKTKEEEDTLLRKKTYEGYVKRVKDKSDKFEEDLEKELAVIGSTGYSGYFLTVQEYIGWAKENNILVGDGRGSGAGSKVAYAIGITEVNPEKYDLLFERFLTPGRQPDFDVDFSDIDAVFKHLQDRYGRNSVARVGAYTRFTCKSGIRKVMSTFGFSQAEIAVVVGWMPKEVSFTLEDARNYSYKFDEWCKENYEIARIVERFEGTVEHYSTHAGGVIICNELTSILPVMTTSEDRDKLIVAMDKKEIEELGHYKFDILGLKSLTLLSNIKEYTGEINRDEMDLEDENIYNMLSKGNVLGVFQLSDQKEKVMQQSPVCFEDLIAINALIRPGVCDWNEYLQKRYEHKDSEEMLSFMKNTHGLIVYQDQYLQLAQHYAGWDIAYSDKHIRKNKNILEDEELKEKWMKDTKERGYDEDEMEKLWETISGIVAGGYGFNRAHSTSYAMLSFQTAYMKYYHPKEFYSAYLTQNIGNKEETNNAINEIKKLGIKLLPPDINEEGDKYIPKEEGILMPISSIKGVGGSALYEINRLRPIKNLQDFLDRRIKKFVKRTVIEALIKAGVFDEEGKTRYMLLKEFNPDGDYKNCKNYQYEKEAFAFYLDKTPFDKLNLKPFSEYRNGEMVVTAVEITDINVRYDRKGKEMAFMSGMNDKDTIRMVVFSSVWGTIKVKEEDIMVVTGKKDGSSLLVNTVKPVEWN